MIRKGDIYLADFGKSRDSFAFGKKRPVLIFQTDKLNFAIKESIYSHVIVIPISTKEDKLTEEFRYKITKRDMLEEDSFVVCNALCFLDTKYLLRKIASLDDEEIEDIASILLDVLDISNTMKL